jgi:hypothetical protein
MKSILPSLVRAYSIKAPRPTIIDNEGNTIITKLQSKCPDGMVYILGQLMQLNNINNDTLGDIRGIYNDCGINQTLFLMKLIGNLSLKTNYDSDRIVFFINKQRKIYMREDKNGDIDKTRSVLVAFDDAKIVFFHLPIIFCHSPITEKEYKYILKNIYWNDRWAECYVIRPFIERFHEVTQQHGGYYENFKLSACLYAEVFALSYITGHPFYPNVVCYLIATMFTGGTIAFLADEATHQPPVEITIPFKKNDNFISLEDMSEVIEHAPWIA